MIHDDQSSHPAARRASVLLLYQLVGAGLLLLGAGALILRVALPFTWKLNRGILPGAILGALVFDLITNSCEELAWRGYAFVAWSWGRDLVLTPGSAASIWTPVGMQEWTRMQWNVAQAILIVVSLVPCAWLLLSPRARQMRAGYPLVITGGGAATRSRRA